MFPTARQRDGKGASARRHGVLVAGIGRSMCGGPASSEELMAMAASP